MIDSIMLKDLKEPIGIYASFFSDQKSFHRAIKALSVPKPSLKPDGRRSISAKHQATEGCSHHYQPKPCLFQKYFA